MKNRFLAILCLLALTLFTPEARAALQKPYPTEPTSEIWTTYDPSLHYYYNQLTDAQKRLFSARYDALALGDSSLWSYQVSSVDAFSRIRVDFVLIHDCPELMFFYDRDFAGYGALQVPSEEYLANNPERLKKLNEECSSAVRAIVSDEMTELEKELAISDYLSSACTYTVEPSEGQTGRSLYYASSSLVDGKALSVGYASGAQYALRLCGIECAVEMGDVKNFGGHDAGHMWNICRINGNWYQCDFSWNAILDVGGYSHINLTTAEMRETRSESPVRAQLEFKHPQCMSSKDNYYVLNGLILGEDWWDDLYRLIKANESKGQRCFSVRFENAEDFNRFVASINVINAFYGLSYPRVDLNVITYADVLFAYLYW